MEAVDKESLAFKTEVAFLGKDHVGSVRHFEGLSLSYFIEATRKELSGLNLDYKEEKLALKGRNVYTSVAEAGKGIYIWVKALELEAGVVVEIRVVHGTEDSAQADELLSNLLGKIESDVANG
ncbi:MAG: hypothetical protein QXV32_02925 [Conexivisphaerales archaeon]